MSPRPGGVEVVVDRVSKSFEEGRIQALADVSFRLEPGDFVSLTGPSGGGKSTLLNLIGALDRPDSRRSTTPLNTGRRRSASSSSSTT